MELLPTLGGIPHPVSIHPTALREWEGEGQQLLAPAVVAAVQRPRAGQK